MEEREREERLRRIKEKKCVVSSGISRKEIGDDALLEAYLIRDPGTNGLCCPEKIYNTLFEFCGWFIFLFLRVWKTQFKEDLANLQ